MKIMELSQEEFMKTTGGDRGCSVKDPRCKNIGKNRDRCDRDWGRIAKGTAEAAIGIVGRIGAIDDDGNASRGEYIREATEGLVRHGWHHMREGFKCKVF